MLAGKTDYTVKPALLSAIDAMIPPFRAVPRQPCAPGRNGRLVGATAHAQRGPPGRVRRASRAPRCRAVRLPPPPSASSASAAMRGPSR
ncbi:hypothetical protein DIE15_25395 [Burkholderia sp. Bp9031]|nr:hypothetical protein DIE15_25395 [Burkholderia sp. Bp9031]